MQLEKQFGEVHVEINSDFLFCGVECPTDAGRGILMMSSSGSVGFFEKIEIENPVCLVVHLTFSFHRHIYIDVGPRWGATNKGVQSNHPLVGKVSFENNTEGGKSSFDISRTMNETSNLLGVPPTEPPTDHLTRFDTRRRNKTSKGFVFVSSVLVTVGILLVFSLQTHSPTQVSALFRAKGDSSMPLMGKSKSKTLSKIDWPDPFARCDYVIDVMTNFARTDDLRTAFQAQAKDPNTFYRATARIFWRDFGSNSYENQTTHWTESDFQSYWIQDLKIKGSNVSLKSLWTWTTGDQHLSNFGAWRNRHGDVVYGVNDFDESSIYDFQIDVLRLAVSIANHAITNGFSFEETEELIKKFANAYVKSVISYVGNEDAALFELTPDTAKGKLKKFLKDVDEDESYTKQMEKFTEISNGRRHFIKGPAVDVPDEDTRLAPVRPDIAKEIRDAISPTRYGATRMKLGWNVHDWDADFFQVLDIAERLGSGIGSYGVDRYYVLLKGTDKLLEEDEDGAAVILDVKYQPPGAVHDVLSPEDEAWYSNMFANDAARVVAAQSRLTSYTDPFLGWFSLPDNNGGERPFSVRQRSPWKDTINLDKLTDWHDFKEYIEQVALGKLEVV